ncbi:class I SAM-dependent methyltransferase [Marinicellulosiphila megalodicopiae]|uniref:class I SAM-dependent methyltransferase n=1 Tax=Marinicellulosiphila megalodicopiae TaxID=2724896 RepID=UPI003BB0FA6B
MSQTVILFNQDHQSHIEQLAKRFDVIYKLDKIDKSKQNEVPNPRFILQFVDAKLSLIDRAQPKLKPLFIDFAEGKNAHRRQFGGGKSQPVAKAVGLSKRKNLHIFDATAGMGADSFVFAGIGATVTMCEQHPVVHALLEDALNRAQINIEANEFTQKMTLLPWGENKNSLTYLDEYEGQFDVIFFDPMFPARQKSAAVKKEMTIFHDLVGEDQNESRFLDVAKTKAKYRVVVKRPKLANHYADQTPSFIQEGKSGRFDLYTINKIP